MMKTVKTVVTRATWGGVPGVSVTHHLDTDRTGLRVCELTLERKKTEVRLIKGDGRKPGFRVLSCGLLPITYKQALESLRVRFVSTQAYGRGKSRSGSIALLVWREGERVRIEFEDGFKMTVHATEVKEIQ